MRRLYCTPYKGNLRQFYEELEDKSTIVIIQLDLENNQIIHHHLKAMATTKTVQKLRQIAQKEGPYEDPIPKTPIIFQSYLKTKTCTPIKNLCV